MEREATRRRGGRILGDQLAAQGVEHVFGVVGEGGLELRDAFREAGVAFTPCGPADGAVSMADAAARLTGKPGVALAMDAPAAHGVAQALHIAHQDGVPLILFVRQPAGGRGACPSLHACVAFSPLAKWVVEVEAAARLPAVVARAFHVAQQGCPGPVVIALAADMLDGDAAVADAPRVVPVAAWPGLTQMADLQKRLWAAARPMLLLGGGGWSAKSCAAAQRFAERFALPVATCAGRAALFNADHPLSAGGIGTHGNLRLIARLAAADLLLLVGARGDELPFVAGAPVAMAVPRPALVHVHPDPDELGRVIHPDLGIQASPDTFASALEMVQPPRTIPWAGAAEAARADDLAWRTDPPGAAPPGEPAISLAAAMRTLRDHLPDEAVVASGGGGGALEVERWFRFRRPGTQLAAPAGALGFALPAAIAAKRLAPHRPVVAVVGADDALAGGPAFGMAAREGLGVIVVVVDDGLTRSDGPEPGREAPDFAVYARALGGHGETVEATADVIPAYRRAEAAGKPAIIHIRAGRDTGAGQKR